MATGVSSPTNIDIDNLESVSFFSDFSQLRFVKIASYENEVN